MCITRLYLNEDCEYCQAFKKGLVYPCTFGDCVYCDEIKKVAERRIRAQARARYAAVIDQVRYYYVVTLTSPPDRPFEDFMKSVNRVKSQKWVVSGKIGYELHKNGAPHCHMSLIVSQHMKNSNIKRLNNGYNVQVKINRRPKEVWEQYLAKAKTQAETAYYKGHDPEKFSESLVEEI